LRETFFVREDRTLADMEDRDYALAEEAVVGIPHPLEISTELQQGWGEVLGDYQILQPFPQLGRVTYGLNSAERGAKEIRRVEGLTCHYGKLLSLEKLGWRRGEPQDAGIVWWMEKRMSDGPQAFLEFEDGLWTGAMTQTPEQTLKTCWVGKSISDKERVPLEKLRPIDFSELVADLETLRG
jgi:hypothetical protein